MGIRERWNNPDREARLGMQEAERQSRERQSESAVDASGKPAPRTPGRYKLYDRIKVSVKTMDIIIYTVFALLVLCLIIGIATGNT